MTNTDSAVAGIGLRFVDSCAMIGKWHQRILEFETVDALLQVMARHRMDKAVVFHSVSWLYDFAEGNRLLDQEIERHAELVPCYAIVPGATQELQRRDLECRLSDGPFAVRLFPRTHNFPLLPVGTECIYDFLEDRCIPVFVDIDEIDYRDLVQLLNAHPELRIIIGNRGTSSLFGIYREFRWLYEVLARFSHVHIETSFLIGFRSIEDICMRFGAGRVLFGTRVPFIEPGSAIARVIYADVGEADKHLIAGGNMNRLLGEVR